MRRKFSFNVDAYRLWQDRIAQLAIYLLTALSVSVLFLIVGYIFVQGIGTLNLEFLIREPRPMGQLGGGISPAILGTLLQVATAAGMAVPAGLLVGVFLSQSRGGWFPAVVRFSLERFAGLPSIVVGVFVWAFMVRNVIGHFAGIAGAFALAIIMFPIVARSVEEILLKAPESLLAEAKALGIPRWRVTSSVLVPHAMREIIAAVAFSIARAAGETAPLLLTSLGNSFISSNMNSPMASLTLQIFNDSMSPYPDSHRKAFAATIVLVMIIAIVFAGSLRLARRKDGTEG